MTQKDTPVTPGSIRCAQIAAQQERDQLYAETGLVYNQYGQCIQDDRPLPDARRRLRAAVRRIREEGR